VTISVTVDLNFADWHLPGNLRDFADTYRSAVLDAITGPAGVHIEQNEAGYSLECTAVVLPSTDLYDAYQALAEEVLIAYRKALAHLVKPAGTDPKGNAAATPATDTHGPRWWIRYVLVPVQGSGAVAAAATTVLALLK